MNGSIFACFIVLLLPAFGKCGVKHWVTTPTDTQEMAEEKWRHLEDQTRTFVHGLMKELLPYVARLNSEMDISPRCQQSILKLISGVKDFKEWSIKMLDASGKLESSLLLGTISAMGSYDDCLNIIEPLDKVSEADTITGMYCVLDFRPPLPPKPKLLIPSVLTVLKDYNSSMEVVEKMKRIAIPAFYSIGYKLAVCLPSQCSKDDLQQVAELATDRLGILTRVRSCEVKEDKIRLDTTQWVITLVILFFLCLVTSASVAHHLIFYEDTKNPSAFEKTVKAFSIFSNIQRLLDTSSEEGGGLSCLHGLRFFSMVWVVFGHTSVFIDFNFQRNFLLKQKALGQVVFQLLANGFLAVDNFLFITSVLVSYSLVSKYSQSKGFNVPVAIFRRIWRLLPSAMFCVGVTILLPALGSGPNWTEHFEEVANNCRKGWWRVALFINNFDDIYDMCLIHTWYISSDLQYFLVALIFAIIYFRKPLLGKAFLGVLLVGATVFTILFVGYMELLPTLLPIVSDIGTHRTTFTYVYFLPTAHLGVYAVGLSVGTYLAKKKEPAMSWWLRLIGWMAAMACSSFALFTTVVWNSGSMYPIGWVPAVYSGIHRPLWAVGLAWLTINCAQGYSGLVNSFLSWKGFIPLNKLSYLVYLLHLLVIYYYTASLRGNVDSTEIAAVYLFSGYLTISFAVALIAKLLFEYPLIVLEQQLFEYLQQTPVKRVEEENDVSKKGTGLEVQKNGKSEKLSAKDDVK